jgi:rhodanese-related sulfurtransferase
MVLTGDSMLAGDVGRPGFGGGDAADQYESMSRLLRLPDWAAVFTGHFEGPCGKGMCGRPSSTIGFERLFSSLTRLERPAFIASLTESVPARPFNMVAIEATNRGGVDNRWAMLTEVSSIAELDMTELRDLAGDFMLIDVREPTEYAASHVAGAINIPQAELASRIDDIPRDTLILTICQAGSRSFWSAQFLAQHGISQVRSVHGGTQAWSEANYPIDSEAHAPHPRIIDSEWAHAGTGTYAI